MTQPSDSIVKAVLGPTNTGKTHYAIERMLGHASGVIGLPLRLLAREVYDKIVARKGAKLCALVTGEEKIIPPSALYYVCTVEAMPLDKRFNFVAVDEVQLMAHHERGHVFTDRVLHARGLFETLFLGAETAREVLAALVPNIKFDYRERFSELHFSGATKLTRLPKRSVIVAFSSAEVYALAELLRRFRGGAAVVMGSLSPRTRNAQADLFQNGDVDFLVATDAIGMGLNLDTEHVAFAGLTKFDGHKRRYLTPMEAAQIAGRAGRFRNDGTFGTTGDCPPMDETLVKRIESHDFDTLEFANWRNSDLDFSTIDSLIDSLHAPRPNRRLRRVKGTADEAALERMIAIPQVREALKTRAQVRQIWEICQVPDFRNLTIDTHVKLLQDIYRMLVMHGGRLPDEFIGKRIANCDDVSGGVDQLSSRLARIRTWNYCASKSKWTNDAKHWVNIAREVEDRLSDALHERLTERFVDRRTSKLLKGIGADAHMDAKIKDDGEVFVDDVLIGRLEGLRFIRDESASELEAKTIAAAAQKIVTPEIDRLLMSLCGGTHAIFTLSDQGEILWGGKAVGRIAASGSIFSPDAELIGGELGTENLRKLATDRMRDFLRSEVKQHLEPLQRLKDFPDQEGALSDAKGFAFSLLENNGAIDRRHFLQQLRELEQEPRRQLRSVGVVFGHFNVYMPDLLRPKPARLLSLLTSYGAGGDKKPFIPFAGVTSIPNEGDLSSSKYAPQALALAGYRAVGPRIIRFDILNRLSNHIRDAEKLFQEQKKDGVSGKKFQIMQEMLALLGSNYEDVRGVLSSLNYESETTEESLLNVAEPLAETTPETPDPVQKDAPEGPREDTAKTSSEDEQKSAISNRAAKRKSSKPTLNLYHNRLTRDDGTTEEIENLEYWSRRMSKGKSKPVAKKDVKRRQRQYTKTPPKTGPSTRQKSFENSPFAALAALKTAEPEGKADKKSSGDKPDKKSKS